MSRTRVARYSLLGVALAVVVAGSALARPASSIKITGPSSVKLNTHFHFKLTGFLAPPATKVAVFEDSSKCKPKQLDELNRASSAEIDQFFPTSGHNFSATENLFARNLGKHYLCAYVFDRSVASHKTYAEAGAQWTNHH